MTNSEVWQNFKLKHIITLEKSDQDLIRKILNAHSKTASEALFYELGKYPLRFVLSKRRLMYLWHLLHRDKNELIRKIYETQKLKTTKGDWFEIIQNERIQNKVSESDLEISLMSKDKFKRIVETKIEFQAIKYLRELASTHSKSAFILNEKFGKKEYFNDRRFSKEDVQILFKLKTKMTN